MNDQFTSIAADTMNEIWGRKPRPFQLLIISHILCTMAGTIKPEPVLLVQSTGSGKSSIPLTCSIVDGGLTIIIENTLALSSDQSSKVKCQANTSNKNVQSFQLDLFKSAEQQQQLPLFIIQHNNINKDTSFILFTLPETLLDATWVDHIKQCISKSILC